MEWIKDTMFGRAEVWGIWQHEVREFSTICDFKGLVVYFNNATDAVHFQLMWQDAYKPVFGDFHP